MEARELSKRRRAYIGVMQSLMRLSAALLYTAGFAHVLYPNIIRGLQNAGSTLTAALYSYAKDEGEFEVAFTIAAILLLLTLAINLAAALVGRACKRRRDP